MFTHALLLQKHCPHCGGYLDVYDEQNITFCKHCHHSILTHLDFSLHSSPIDLPRFWIFALKRNLVLFIFALLMVWAINTEGNKLIGYVLIVLLIVFYIALHYFKPSRHWLRYKDYILQKGVDKVSDLDTRYEFATSVFSDNAIICPHCTSQQVIRASDISPKDKLFTKGDFVCSACQTPITRPKKAKLIVSIAEHSYLVGFILGLTAMHLFNLGVYSWLMLLSYILIFESLHFIIFKNNYF